MKADVNLQQISHSFSRFMHRYHVIIFAVVILGGLSIATFALYQTFIESQAPTSTTETTGFDQTTMDKISKLRSSSDTATPLTLPPGRTNPFQE